MTRLVLAAVILSIVAQAESVAGAALVLDAVHRVEVDERGVWRLETEKGPLLTGCGLRVWAKERFESQANARVSAPAGDWPGGRAFNGTLRCGQRRVEYWETLTPVVGGLLVQYAVAAGELAETEEVAACFELPLATYAGAAFAVEPSTLLGPGPGKPAAVPAEKGAAPRLIEVEGTVLTVERDGRGAETPRPQAPEGRGAETPRLQFQRRPGGRIIVQDARHWENPWVEVQLYLKRAVGDPVGWRSVSFLVSVGKGAAGPVIAAVAPGKATLGCHEVHEAEVVFWAPYENPYDPTQVEVTAEVMGPSQPGAAVPHAGFYTRDYVRSQEEGAERLAPVGVGRWRVRMTPTEPGPHVYTVKVKTPWGTAEWQPLRFSAAPSGGQRFLRPPKGQTRYLEDARGEPCLLIGHNLCWLPRKEGTYAAEAALARMAAAGINATRLWLCSWGIGVEGGRPDDYRLDGAWRLDCILGAARERGIYVQLCLDNFQDLAAPERAGQNPYLAANGGPCQAPGQFFSHPAARAQHQRRLRYLAARYGPYTSLLAWELFNEVAYATDTPRDPAVLAWTKEAGGALKRLDPYGHPVTIGVGLRGDWDELWRLPEVDMVQAHAYIPRPTERSEPRSGDASALVLGQQDAFEPLRKPVLVPSRGALGVGPGRVRGDGDALVVGELRGGERPLLPLRGAGEFPAERPAAGAGLGAGPQQGRRPGAGRGLPRPRGRDALAAARGEHVASAGGGEAGAGHAGGRERRGGRPSRGALPRGVVGRLRRAAGDAHGAGDGEGDAGGAAAGALSRHCVQDHPGGRLRARGPMKRARRVSPSCPGDTFGGAGLGQNSSRSSTPAA